MKKIILKCAFLVAFFGIATFFISCSNDSVESVSANQSSLIEYQTELNRVFRQTTNSIKLNQPKSKEQFKALLTESYVDVYGKNANLAVFEESFSGTNNNRKARKSDFVESKISEIMFSSVDENQALNLLELLINDENVSVEDKLDFINMKESLLFIADNHEFIEDNLLAKVGKKVVPPNKVEKPKSWWNSWGKCVAGTLGGAITGGGAGLIGGAVAGTVALPVIGTVSLGTVGGVLGAVGGGLTGAAASC